MSRRIDLTTKDAFCTRDCQLRDLFAKLILGTLSGQSGFALGSLAGFGNDAGCFGTRLFNQMRSLLLAGSANFGGTGASLLDLGLDALFSGGELGLGLIGCSQTIGDSCFVRRVP